MAKGKTLADRLIAEIRRAEKSGLTRYRLAKLADVSQGQLSKITRGHIVPSLTTAEKITKALRLEIRIGPAKSSCK